MAVIKLSAISNVSPWADNQAGDSYLGIYTRVRNSGESPSETYHEARDTGLNNHPTLENPSVRLLPR